MHKPVVSIHDVLLVVRAPVAQVRAVHEVRNGPEKLDRAPGVFAHEVVKFRLSGQHLMFDENRRKIGVPSI